MSNNRNEYQETILSVSWPQQNNVHYKQNFSSRLRWLVLILSSFYSFSVYFWFDSPNSLSNLLKAKVVHDKESANSIKYNMLYSVYSYPNIILPLVGGFIIDKFGIHFASIMFTSLTAAGQCIFAISGFIGTDDQNNNLPYVLAIIGRIAFGIGGDSVYICSTYTVTRWFKDKELSLSLSIILSIACSGTIINNNITPLIADQTSLGIASSVGCIFCIVSLVWAIIICILENSLSNANKVLATNDQLVDNERFSWQDLRELSISFWIVSCMYTFTYVGLITFSFVSNDFFWLRYNFNQLQASRITANTFAVAVVFSPFVGLFADKYGHRITLCMIASSLGVLAQVMLIIIPSSDPHEHSYLCVIPLVLIGVSHCVFLTAVWPMVWAVIKPNIIGSGLGVCTIINNIGLAITPVVVGMLAFKDKGDDMYFWANWFLWAFLMIGFFAMMSTILLWQNFSQQHLAAAIDDYQREWQRHHNKKRV